MRNKIIWHGHANFQIVTPKISILIDPFFEGNPSVGTTLDAIPKPDLVLVTHDHADHTGQAVEICRNTGAMLGAVVGTAERLVQQGLPASQVLNTIGFNIGGTVEVNGVKITMTEAFHSSESGVPVGYIITLGDGMSVYHAGDTGIFSNMKTWGKLYDIDLALLPIGGVFTMDAQQAAYAAKMLRCRGVIPMHWGTFPVLEANTDEFRRQIERFCPECRLFDLKPGDSIELQNEPEECDCES